ncbi:hypothetical protein IV203_023208 [Nitzschia inconspicua]|uniref:Uncharacterized protein n=1 Tax=Nitzschia inconspicua TaxID=303405 RepID=A0A9K3KD36_9STRA|nr:hypothetical protein IV203_023208 [Nitzschia inconspicua]
MAGCSGNNEDFNCDRAYNPNGQARVFYACFKHYLTHLWGDFVARRVMPLMSYAGSLNPGLSIWKPLRNTFSLGSTSIRSWKV